jgi:hypothetical protein
MSEPSCPCTGRRSLTPSAPLVLLNIRLQFANLAVIVGGDRAQEIPFSSRERAIRKSAVATIARRCRACGSGSERAAITWTHPSFQERIASPWHSEQRWLHPVWFQRWHAVRAQTQETRPGTAARQRAVRVVLRAPARSPAAERRAAAEVRRAGPQARRAARQARAVPRRAVRRALARERAAQRVRVRALPVRAAKAARDPAA